jgi:hypothetical protein
MMSEEDHLSSCDKPFAVRIPEERKGKTYKGGCSGDPNASTVRAGM